MRPERLYDIMKTEGRLENYEKSKVFHSQHFSHRLFMINKGYVKRYQVTNEEKVIELIYGPQHIFPLSQLYEKIFGVKQNQENFIYVYQAMTDIEVYSLGERTLLNKLEADPLLYIDLYYESGLRLKSNINRLASNSFRDYYKKIAHQLYCLAEEFGRIDDRVGSIKIEVPLEPIDVAEQLNITEDIASAVLDYLKKRKLITYDNLIIGIPNLELLKDIYL